MPNEKNQARVADLTEKSTKAKSIVIAEYHGLNSNLVNELRAKIRETGAEMQVAKNTLVKIALGESGYDVKNVEEDLDGPNATIFAYEDPITAIKALFDFAKTNNELPKVKAGFIEGQFADAQKMEEVSKIPSKEVLMGQVVSGLKSPIFGIVGSLGGISRKLVYVMDAISKKKGVQ